ncbi:MAG: hypothetical protein JOZ62_12815, partial [Acidobacteriaceae bacterium]|nr:hypothetical protein [Acidobacteriaceae bacterium]
MGLKIVDCNATETTVTVFFSDPVNSTQAVKPGSYAIEYPLNSGSSVNVPLATPTYDPVQNAAFLTFSGSFELNKGDWLSVTVNGISGFDATGDNTFATRVNGGGGSERNIRRTTRAVEDAVSFPVLTEEVGFAPSPLAPSPGAPSGAPGSAALGAVVTKAVGDVLGWKVKADDAKGFVGALNASFTGSPVDGRIAYNWTPRTYAVQTDLAGGITGAQASLYTRAKDALDNSLPLLDGLYPLDPEADAEDIAALKAIARSQLTELVRELGFAGGPRVSRVNQYFQMLITSGAFPPAAGGLVTDPDQIGGTLGTLRDLLGLNFTEQDFVNTVQDEQDLSNFRILSDYITSLAQSWINNQGFFGLDTPTPFFGTQLVLLSRQLLEVAETVDEVRFTLDSVFIGPAERQTLELQFGPGTPPLFIEDLLTWIQSFAATEGPQLIQDGGKLAVQSSFLPIVKQLQALVRGARNLNLNRRLPRGFHTSRVQRALEEVQDGLDELESLAAPIRHAPVPEPSAADLRKAQQQIDVLTAEVDSLANQGRPLVGFPLALDFGEERVGSTSPPQSISIANFNGSATIRITTISVSGPDFKILSITGPDGKPVASPPSVTQPLVLKQFDSVAISVA